jgi:hypothetical protein
LAAFPAALRRRTVRFQQLGEDFMTWREVCEADLPECLNIEPRHRGDEIVGRELATAAWKKLIRSRSFHSCVIESASLPGRILGFGASLFVTSEFATRELQYLKPGLNSRIIAAIANQEPAIRPEADLYNTPVDEPLDEVTLYGNWPDALLSAEQLEEVKILLPVSFIESHSGYRLNRLFVECAGPVQSSFVESSGVWRVAKRFAESQSILAVMTREDALAVSGSIAFNLFQYREPALGLRDSERCFLAEALSYHYDVELGKKMNLSPATIKKRWQSLFDKIAEVKPDLLPVEENGRARQSRGPQKRHRILAYVRSHPQELRPYRWRTSLDS